MIIGLNKDEGILWWTPQLLDPTKWQDVAGDVFLQYGAMTLFGIAYPEDMTALDLERTRQVAEFYVGGAENINEENSQGMVDMITDSAFAYGTFQTIGLLAERGVTVFSYLLTYRGQEQAENILSEYHRAQGVKQGSKKGSSVWMLLDATPALLVRGVRPRPGRGLPRGRPALPVGPHFHHLYGRVGAGRRGQGGGQDDGDRLGRVRQEWRSNPARDYNILDTGTNLTNMPFVVMNNIYSKHSVLSR